MATLITFFNINLSLYHKASLILLIIFNILSHYYHLETDKLLIKIIPKIIYETDDTKFTYTIGLILIQNMGYLLFYIFTVIGIEIISKLAVKNAVNKKGRNILNAKLDCLSKLEYEYMVTSLVHHTDNVSNGVKNLFIEFPRKLIACCHFLIALQEIGWDVMIYCTLINIIFAGMVIGISYARKYLADKILGNNTQFSIICSDIANSVQTYKVDDRLIEYENKINKITINNWYLTSIDTVLSISTDTISVVSSQLITGLLAYTSRSLFLAQMITLEDVLYGIKSSGKMVEKLINVIEYASDVIRQYKSFAYFNPPSWVTSELASNNHPIEKIVISTPAKEVGIYTETPGGINHLTGPNGVGKTTCLYKFLGVDYRGATTNSTMMAVNYNQLSLKPHQYKKNVGFVAQLIPITYDTIDEYFPAVSGTLLGTRQLVEGTLKYFAVEPRTYEGIIQFINNLGENKRLRELSGGQGKMIQILATICKLWAQKLSLLILDEPTNNLDIEKIEYVKDLLLKLVHKNVHIFLVTHDDRLHLPRLEINL